MTVSPKSSRFRVRERIPLTCILHLLHYNFIWRLEVGDHHIEGITNCLCQWLWWLSPSIVVLANGEALEVFQGRIHHGILGGKEHHLNIQMYLSKRQLWQKKYKLQSKWLIFRSHVQLIVCKWDHFFRVKIKIKVQKTKTQEETLQKALLWSPREQLRVQLHIGHI